MTPVLLSLPGNDAFAAALARATGAPLLPVDVHRFPDGEAKVRVPTPLDGRDAVVVASLDRPDDKLVPLLFALHAARDAGAARVRLVAPYLAYLRQDRAFAPGEAVSAQAIAGMLGPLVDELVTVEPHLHRIADLSALWGTPVKVVHAGTALAPAVRAVAPRAVVVGPDEESHAWVRDLAAALDAPFVVLRKERRGDRDVSVSAPGPAHAGRTPVLVDDILSTGRTLAAAAERLREAGWPPAVCAVVHPLFAPGADEALAGVRVVACNTVAHPLGTVDVAPLVAEALGLG